MLNNKKFEITKNLTSTDNLTSNSEICSENYVFNSSIIATDKINNFISNLDSQILIPKLVILNLTNNTKKIIPQGMRKQNYKMHSVEIKSRAISLAKEHPLPIVSQMLNVPLKSLKRWMIFGPVRQKGGGRKIKDPAMEKQIVEWYKNKTKDGSSVTSNELKKKALELSSIEGFKASKGWLEKIKNKYKFE